MRKKVETVFSQITEMFPRNIRAVTSKGFEIKLFNFILAHTFKLLFREKFALVERLNCSILAFHFCLSLK